MPRSVLVILGVLVVLSGLPSTTVGATGAAPTCTDALARPEVSGPQQYVLGEPDTFEVQILANGYRAACGDRTLLSIERVSPNPRHLAAQTDDQMSSDYEDLGDRAICRPRVKVSCPFSYDDAVEVPVEVSSLGGGRVRIPADLGPGRFALRAVIVRGNRRVESPRALHLLTATRYAAADRAARDAMTAYALIKERAAATKSGDSRKALEGDARLLRALADSHRQFLRYERTDTGDRLVEVFGELVGARRVAVSVPGLKQTARNGHDFDSSCQCARSAHWVSNAERLWKRAAVINGEDNTAVIAYLGYDAPNLSNVISINAAFNGAEELAGDLDAWAIPDSAHLTIVAHSYGSVMVGVAVGLGASADDVVYIGSPGVGVYRRSNDCDFQFNAACCPGTTGVSCYRHVDSHHVWSARFGEDPVPNSADRNNTLGVLPTNDAFGAIEFHTEPPDCQNPLGKYNLLIPVCHSRYFNWDQESLDNITRVVLGRYRKVTLVGEHPSVPKDLGTKPTRLGWPDPSGVGSTAAPTYQQIAGAKVPALCEGLPATTLVNGKNVEIPAGHGDFQIRERLESGTPGVVSGIASNDAGPLTAVVASCSHGGVAWPNSIVFFSAGPVFYAETFLDDPKVSTIGDPAREGIVTVSREGGSLVVYVKITGPGDAACCSSYSAFVHVVARDGAIKVTKVEEDLGD